MPVLLGKISGSRPKVELNQMTPYEEKQLLNSVAEGDETAFRLVFDYYGQLLFPYLRRLLRSAEPAEEIVQETMLRVWLSRDRLPEIEFPTPWVFKIAANLAYNTLQRRLKEEGILRSLVPAAESSEDPEARRQFRELVRLTREAIRLMPPERRRIYLLSRDAGLDRHQIAEQLHISPSTVKNTLTSAIASIRDYLQKAGYCLPACLLLILCTKC